jgi:Ca-activated chloride channel homolog
MDHHERHGTRIPQLARVLIIATFWILPATPAFVFAQETEDVVRVRTDLVVVPVIVTDGRGRRLPDLEVSDFLLTDNGRNVNLEYFASGTDRVALLFALDTSGSARDTLTQQREAATAIFSRFGKGSRIAVLQFGSVVRLPVPFTSNTEAAENAFNFEAIRNAPTAIFDAAAAAVGAFTGEGGFSMERRIVILISDGLDTLSSTKYTSVIDQARLRGVSFYVIHLQLFVPKDGRLAPRSPSKGFRELAEQTGGRYFRIGNAHDALTPNAKIDLSAVFKAIEDDLRGQYVLGFYPGEASRDQRTHSLSVSLKKSRPRVKVIPLRSEYDLHP